MIIDNLLGSCRLCLLRCLSGAERLLSKPVFSRAPRSPRSAGRRQRLRPGKGPLPATAAAGARERPAARVPARLGPGLALSRGCPARPCQVARYMPTDVRTVPAARYRSWRSIRKRGTNADSHRGQKLIESRARSLPPSLLPVPGSPGCSAEVISSQAGKGAGGCRVRSCGAIVRAGFCTLSPGLPPGLEEPGAAAAAAVFTERSCPDITPLAWRRRRWRRRALDHCDGGRRSSRTPRAAPALQPSAPAVNFWVVPPLSPPAARPCVSSPPALSPRICGSC